MKTYIVEGGIGKCVAFSALIEKLAERDGGQVQIHTPWHEVFGGNPKVKWVFDGNSVPLTDSRILESDEIVYCEPYKSNFVKGQEHLIESYCKLLGVEYSEDMKPKLYTDHAKGGAEEVLKNAELNGKYMLVQFTGGQPAMNAYAGQQYMSGDPGRNYPYYLAQQVINGLRESNPDVTIINYSLPNEPSYEGTVRLEASFPVWHEIVKNAEGFIAIDSSLNHLATAAGCRGVTIWGSTRWNQFGYKENVNVNFHGQDTWDESSFDGMDPRNVMVDPQLVVQLYNGRKK